MDEIRFYLIAGIVITSLLLIATIIVCIKVRMPTLEKKYDRKHKLRVVSAKADKHDN